MKALSRRTETFTDSVIRRMTRVCLKCGAVNLSQGFPDFDPSKALKGYATHPAHVAVANAKVRPFAQTRLCLDYTC